IKNFLTKFGLYIISLFCIPDENICNLPYDEGINNDGAFRIYLYYNRDSDKCLPFKYYGNGGNGNRFLSEKDCMRNCSVNAQIFYPVPDSEACHFKKVSGECFSQYLRYYYDSVHMKCKKFLWSGCVGNGNRFMDYNTCNATCSGIHGELALIVGVVLGITGAIILIVVIVVIVKK
uniref:BPTI/Kunitz inhibitor domain-containing protein n=1 Tax=Denticeps clupeoides TaxID=299321 RepID=A0AAY4DL00_9TELE